MIGLDFDPDEMARLFQTDLDAANRLRDELIAAAINAAPPEKRAWLRDFQRVIDMRRVCCYDASLDTHAILLCESMQKAGTSIGVFVEIAALAKGDASASKDSPQ
jgi:hypothetical protein